MTGTRSSSQPKTDAAESADAKAPSAYPWTMTIRVAPDEELVVGVSEVSFVRGATSDSLGRYVKSPVLETTTQFEFSCELPLTLDGARNLGRITGLSMTLHQSSPSSAQKDGSDCE
jgi:hypothetical protein